MASHALTTSAPTCAPLLPCPMPLHRRKAIAAAIQRHLARVDVLIARLDRADAPFEDLEDEHDFGADDQGDGGSWPEGFTGSATPAIADDDQEDDGRELRKPHVRRLRANRCDVVKRGSGAWGFNDYHLRRPRAASFGRQPGEVA